MNHKLINSLKYFKKIVFVADVDNLSVVIAHKQSIVKWLIFFQNASLPSGISFQELFFEKRLILATKPTQTYNLRCYTRGIFTCSSRFCLRKETPSSSLRRRISSGFMAKFLYRFFRLSSAIFLISIFKMNIE